jgi:hypothetical protein
LGSDQQRNASSLTERQRASRISKEEDSFHRDALRLVHPYDRGQLDKDFIKPKL